MKAQIIKTMYIEAARRIHDARTGRNTYTGNSYRIDVIAEGDVDPNIGWVIDYADIKRFFEPVRRQLDHCCLSNIPALADDASPAALEHWIGEQLRPWPSWFAGVRVSLPASRGFALVHLESEAALGLPDRVAFSFSAAQSLPQLPVGHPCRELHGHTYQIEIAPASLQQVEAAASEVFDHLDNSCINDLPGLEQATAERIAAWIWHFLVAKGAVPELVVVQETPSNRCCYFGG